MSIPEIKSRLSILTVLSRYGLEPNGNGMLKCPFHDDGKASMRVYADTGTVYCFAGSCDTESLDVIDFIMKMDKSTKREAILKAKKWAGAAQVIASTNPVEGKLDIEAIYKESLAGMQRTPTGKAYCSRRKLDVSGLGIGYRSRKSKERWGRGCIIFPLLDEKDNVVSLYGRAVKGPGHYYTAGRRGLFPEYPNRNVKQLVLTESVIDAASLVYQERNMLAMYGTNGLTEEHKQAILGLAKLEEIILALDADEAGRKAAVAISSELKKLRPGMKVTTIELPEGEDVNGYWVSQEDPVAAFEELFEARQPVAEVEQKSGQVKPVVKAQNELAVGEHYLSYVGEAARYRIRGGVRGGADSLKVSVQISAASQDYRAKVDLYEYKQSQGLAEQAAEVLGIRKDLLLRDLTLLTDLLEQHREQAGNERGDRPAQVEIPAGERKAALSFLKRTDLLEQLGDYLGRSGIVGEQKSRLLLYLVALSHGTDEPLHALVQGTSGSGKTHLITKIAELLPDEEVITLTRVTDSSFYNYARDELRHKLIVLEDLDGLKEEALLAFRELQSRGRLSSSTSVKDQAGNIRGQVRTVLGPVASLAATTMGEIYEDNLSRSLVVAVDESQAQTEAVIDYQNRRAAGLVDTTEEKQLRLFLRTCARLLDRSKTVVNPYATKIQLPAEASKLRRLNALYQSFVRQIVLLHQYQRKTDHLGRLIAEPSDLQAACDILFDAILLKVDELDGALRYFYERLKTYVLTRGKDYEFSRREVRQALRISKTQQHTYLTQLLELEYVKQTGGYANRGLLYKIAYWDNVEVIRSRIQADLRSQVEKIQRKGERHGTPERTPAYQ
ncbi:MAG: toprim domain-containing protein [Bacteroidota bacterium]